MHSIVQGVLTYAVVPGFMALMLLVGVGIAVRAESAHRLSAYAGLGIGFMTFVIYYMISGDLGAASRAGLTSLSFAWLPITLGLAVGFTVLWVAEKAAQLRAGLQGLITMFLTATSSIALFGYFYDSPMRNFIVLFAASTTVGILLYFVFFSHRVRKLLRKPASTV
ncbi:hypothetical protein [Amycolatopsis magusensis]|uniref:hypothetical protein n=1 Tax=Amycolatopsis magusensis TaxID=882444 RepID=UPI003C2F74CE